MAARSDMVDRLPPGARVAVIRLRSLGDCVLSTPAIQLLKQHRPDMEIGVVVEDRFADVYRNHPAVSAVIPPALRPLRAFAPALCLNLHGGTRSARLTALSGASVRAGFDIFRPAWVYTHRLPTAQVTMNLARRVHTAEHAASAAFALGVPQSEIPRAHIATPAGRSPHAPPGRFAILHPFAATPEKTWPAGNFVRIAERLRLRGLEPVIIGGPSDDLGPFSGFPTLSGAPLSEVARLVRDAALFLGNDSGPAHVGAAFGIPEVVLFGPSDAEIWSPWRTASRVLRCTPITDIATNEVEQAIGELLQ